MNCRSGIVRSTVDGTAAIKMPYKKLKWTGKIQHVSSYLSANHISLSIYPPKTTFRRIVLPTEQSHSAVSSHRNFHCSSKHDSSFEIAFLPAAQPAYFWIWFKHSHQVLYVCHSVRYFFLMCSN